MTSGGVRSPPPIATSADRSIALYEAYITRIRKSHPSAISFINPPIFESPSDLSEEVKQGRMVLSSHFYDGLTMLGKRRHKFNAVSTDLLSLLEECLQFRMLWG